jgi:DNA helicase-2/ATP-dependent DNA helicase PcrA
VIVDIIKTSSSNSFSNLEKENLNTPLQIGEGTGVRYKDNLILYRMNAQSRVIEEALLRENIPYRVIGGMKFYDRAEIKDLLAYLKVIHNGNDVVSMKRIINKPTRKIGDRTIEVVDNYREKFDKNYLQVIENIDEVSELNNGAKNALKSFLELYKHLLSVSKELVVADLIKEVLKATSYIEFITE